MALDRHVDDVDLLIILRELRLNLADLREDGVVLNSNSQTGVHELLD